MQITVNIEDGLIQKGMSLAGIADCEAFLNLAVADFIQSEQAAGFAGLLFNMSPSEAKKVYAEFFKARDVVLNNDNLKTRKKVMKK
jgi:Bacterial antitoxin of type II TA system, VapB